MTKDNYIIAVKSIKGVRPFTSRYDSDVNQIVSIFNQLNEKQQDLLLRMHCSDENILLTLLKKIKNVAAKEIIMKNIFIHPQAKTNIFAYNLKFEAIKPLFLTNSESFNTLLDNNLEPALKFFYLSKTKNANDKKYLEAKFIEFLIRNCNHYDNLLNLKKIFNNKTSAGIDDSLYNELLLAVIFEKYPLDNSQKELFMQHAAKIPVVLSFYQKFLLSASDLNDNISIKKSGLNRI